MLIWLSPMTTCRGVFPVFIVKLLIGGRICFAADPKQGAKGVEGLKRISMGEILFAPAVSVVAVDTLGADDVRHYYVPLNNVLRSNDRSTASPIL
jgi:hypothetical protein